MRNRKKEKSKMVKFTNQTSVEEEETEEVYISNFKKSQNKLQEVPKINFKKFTFQTLIILILTILILVRINLIISYLQMGWDPKRMRWKHYMRINL